jgi:hypothetical protein
LSYCWRIDIRYLDRAFEHAMDDTRQTPSVAHVLRENVLARALAEMRTTRHGAKDAAHAIATEMSAN